MNFLSVIPWNRLSTWVDATLQSPSVQHWVMTIGSVLKAVGVPEDLLPDAEQIALSITVVIVTLVSYWYWLGRSHHLYRAQLQKRLREASQVVKDLEEKLLSLEALDLKEHNTEGREIRVWMDGAFDMMHYGHMNAFRQGRALGTTLIVGVNSDETITQCKGAPIMDDDERTAMVRACKWVDEVVQGVPYIMNDEYLSHIIKKYKIDYVVHGDDPCIVNGKDVYESAQKMGKYLTIPRTEGISTTDIVGRMLLVTRSHHSPSFSDTETSTDNVTHQLAQNHDISNEIERKTNFLTTSRTIRLFSAGLKAPTPKNKVVYIPGAWDMFHAGHVQIIEEARKLGDYVIVGVYNDTVINSLYGMNWPIMNLHERVLSCLGCKFVDDALIDAPYIITREMIMSLNISVVVRGSLQPEYEVSDTVDGKVASGDTLMDPYAVPRAMGILQVVPSPSTLTASTVVERVLQQRERFKQKYERKKIQEDEYYNNLYKKEPEQKEQKQQKKKR